MLSTAIVLAAHASFLLIRLHEPAAVEAPMAPILLDLALDPRSPFAPVAPNAPPEPAPPAPTSLTDATPAPAPQSAETPVVPQMAPLPPRPKPTPRPQVSRLVSHPPLPSAPHKAVAAEGQQTQSLPTETASAAAAANTGDAMATWRHQLLAHLSQFKQFPAAAQRRGEQGVVMMRFKMDRAGSVLAASVEVGSGYADLDAAAEAWIKRAEPMPKLPPEMTERQIELLVPLRFNLR